MFTPAKHYERQADRHEAVPLAQITTRCCFRPELFLLASIMIALAGCATPLRNERAVEIEQSTPVSRKVDSTCTADRSIPGSRTPEALITRDPVDPTGDECVPPNEAAALQAIVRSIEAHVRKAAESAPARRDAHPKAHGCVRAEFRVLPDLPSVLRVGVFEQPRSYQALIRFSNASETPQDDMKADGRGMALKLLGVTQSRSTTQDFIMVNHPVFFVRNASDYVDLQAANPAWRFFVPSWNPFRLRLHELFVARATSAQKVSNPLNSRYWSMTPYLFGGTSGKFSARPAGLPSPFTDTAGAEFLHDNLARHLESKPAEFDFLVQLRTRPDRMPIEDPTVEWPEADAPFVRAARITIFQQGFDDPAQRAACENLSFSPWHGLTGHRPLGGINRVRRAVYETISKLRHDLNGTQRSEPAASERPFL